MSSNSFEFTTPDDEDRSHAHMTTLQYMMNAVGTTLPTVVPRHTRVVGANWQRRSWATEEYLNVRTQPVSSTVETRQQRRLARVSGASDSLSLTAVESSHRGVESAIVLQSLRPLQGLQGAAGHSSTLNLVLMHATQAAPVCTPSLIRCPPNMIMHAAACHADMPPHLVIDNDQRLKARELGPRVDPAHIAVVACARRFIAVRLLKHAHRRGQCRAILTSGLASGKMCHLSHISYMH